MPTPVIPVSIRFPVDVHEEVGTVARDTDSSFNAMVVHLIRDALSRRRKAKT